MQFTTLVSSTVRSRLAVLLAAGLLLLVCSCRTVGRPADAEPKTLNREAAVSAAADRLAARPSPVRPPESTPEKRSGASPASGSTVTASAPTRQTSAPEVRHAGTPRFTNQGSLPTRLKAVVDEAVAGGVARSIGIAVYDMASEQGYGLNLYQNFKPASVIKLAVLVAAFRARSAMTPAQFDRLRPDLERMITVSDNASTRRLVNRLGSRRVNAAIEELGLKQFRLGTSRSRSLVLQGSQAAPADTALLLAKIARREVVSPQSCDEMLALLGAQQKRRRIPAGLPQAQDLWVGNKTGTLSGIVNDAGVILQPARGVAYTVAIFTAGTRSESDGERLLADLSAVVYGYMAAQAQSRGAPHSPSVPG